MKPFLFRIVLAALSLLHGLIPTHAAISFLDDEAEPQTNISFKVQPAASGSLTVVFDYRDNKNFYALDLSPVAAALRATVAGKVTTLATAAIKPKAGSNVTIKRRRWVMQVVLDRRVALTAYDSSFESGRIGASTAGGWKWTDARVQPVEDVYFSDDFTRAAGEQGEWKAIDGKWKLTATSDSISASNAEMSANPFAFEVSAPNGTAMASSGRWFWDNYDAQVSVRPQGRGAIGLAIYVQDADNYLAFWWSAQDGPSARRLVRVVDGQSTVLARSAGAWLPGQWYRVGVRASPGFVETFIDGVPIFRSRENSFGQGGIALLAQKTTANFDDVKARSYEWFRQDFSGASDGAWNKQGGSWAAQNGVVTSAALAGDGGKTRFFVAGRSDWQGYQFIASARVGPSGAGGLVVGFRDDQNYTVFRWAGPQSTLPYRGRQQLMRYQNGKALIVADEPAKVLSQVDKEGFARIRLRLERGALTVYAGADLIAQMADETLEAGRPALWSQGLKATAFRDVVIFFPPPPETPRVPPRMEEDAVMSGWASTAGEWPMRRTDSGLEFWNSSEFFGDATLEFDWRRATYARGKAEIALRARDGDFSSGYLLRLEGEEDRSGLKLTLERSGTMLKQAAVKFREGQEQKEGERRGSTPIRVQLEGRALLVSVGDRPSLSYLAATAASLPQGTRFGARAVGFTLRGSALRTTSTLRDDYTFNDAPTDWYAPSGQWSVISRWPCYSDWSFFGGRGLNPILWSKRTYSGDTVVEMYAHAQMDLPKEMGYSHPGDLNISLAGDGKNPFSGYSFVVAGWDNTRTRIYRGTQMVAESTGEGSHFERPINLNFQFHKRWSYIRAEARRLSKSGKNGVQIQLSIDDVLIAQWFDPNPLPRWTNGGRVAFWSLDNTVMIARAKIESRQMGIKFVPADVVQAATPPKTAGAISGADWVPRPLLVDGHQSTFIAATDEQAKRPAWRICNASPGGLFGVRWVKAGSTEKAAGVQVGLKTRLEWEMALPPEVKIDAYLTIDGQRHLISISGAEKPDASALLLGAAQHETLDDTNSNGAKWQRLSFDVGSALHKIDPNGKSWVIEAIEFGALHGDPYRWIGINGNPMGASYDVRGLKISAG